MEFKVGDRVELLEPADGVGEEYANEIGVGTIKAIGCDGSIKVELDGNFHSWWYKPEQLRHVLKPTPTPSITQAEADRMRGDKIREELYGVKYAKSPITVGTQVRLTGVVGDKDGDKRIRVDFGEDAEDEWAWIPCKAKCLEVMRKPFKRNEEVAYDHVPDNAPDNEWALVIRDEGPDGMFWMVYKHLEAKVHQRHFSEFKRRPERRP